MPSAARSASIRNPEFLIITMKQLAQDYHMNVNEIGGDTQS